MLTPLQNKFKNLCMSLGKNNKALYGALTIAVSKGILRPTFTMMDKTEKPETKKYTALREGLTELIAIPTYLACGELAAHLSKKIKFKNVPEDVKKSLTKRAARNFMFIGVCVAALFVIPGLCSIAIKPIMDKLLPNNKPKSPAENLDPQLILHNPLLKKPDMSTFTGKRLVKPVYNTQIRPQLKVGGV